MRTKSAQWSFIKSVLSSHGVEVDESIKVPDVRKKRVANWLEPDEIKKYVIKEDQKNQESDRMVPLLSAHLRIPAEISMEIGGWSNDKTMEEIYTHIARSDIERCKNEMWDFII